MGLFDRIEKAVKAFQERKFCIIYSEAEGEGDLCFPAQEVTAEAILTMARVASGLICLALPKKRLEQLEIDKLPSKYAAQDTPFYQSVDAVGVGSGISPKDRAFTVKRMIDPEAKPEDFSRPGHLQLLGACDSIMERGGHTEGVIELTRLAGIYPAAILAEIISDSGDMATAKELKTLARKLRIPIITVGALAKFVRSLLPKNT